MAYWQYIGWKILAEIDGNFYFNEDIRWKIK